MRSIFTFTQLSVLALATCGATLAQAADGMAGRQLTELRLGLDQTEYLGVNVKGGYGFHTGLVHNYFFSDKLGVLVGAEYSSRSMTFDGTGHAKEHIAWLEIPVGLVLDVTNGMAMAHVTAYADAGIYYAKNLKKTSADATIGGLQGGIGLYGGAKSYYEINEQMSVGAYVTVKYGFFSPFKGFAASNPITVDLGLSGAFKF